ncbi:hypothetical protein [Streptomyces minutiscleroticus]|uniref:Uncharacterized protein n=1 Tax=Streptomyces minutiscleroticus TaxID=68238 RepID=A0A918K6C6_9ACTN|nr:hypothetical protein [Streptomyces minutiscleroticus]GGX51712.1 hypothetical protein GCM10010358_01670 [Streptomyces minutiscleroticus]
MTSNARVVAAGAGPVGGRPAGGTRGPHPHRETAGGGRPVGGVPAGAPARAREGAEPLPSDGTSPLHPLTHDGGS